MMTDSMKSAPLQNISELLLQSCRHLKLPFLILDEKSAIVFKSAFFDEVFLLPTQDLFDADWFLREHSDAVLESHDLGGGHRLMIVEGDNSPASPKILSRKEFIHSAESLVTPGEDPHFLVTVLSVDRVPAVPGGYRAEVGEKLMEKVVQRLQGLGAGLRLLGRVGASELLLLLPCDLGMISGLVDNVVELLSRPFIIGGAIIPVSAHLGIADREGTHGDIETMLKEAGLALSSAKESRNSVMYYEKGMRIAFEDATLIRTNLRGAMMRGETHLVYMPLISLPEKEVIGFEALMRWNFESRFIPPSFFIPIAEESGAILQIGRWISKQVCDDLKTLQKSCRIAMNLSPVQLLNKDFVESLTGMAGEQEVDFGRIELEITESVLISQPEEALANIKILKEHGFRISLDDFGSDYSSLRYLKKFPFDTIKIDQEFIRDLENNATSRAIISAVITLALDLGVEVVAEGISTEEQLSFLTEKGCSIYQGFLGGKPGLAMSWKEFQRGDVI